MLVAMFFDTLSRFVTRLESAHQFVTDGRPVTRQGHAERERCILLANLGRTLAEHAVRSH